MASSRLPVDAPMDVISVRQVRYLEPMFDIAVLKLYLSIAEK